MPDTPEAKSENAPHEHKLTSTYVLKGQYHAIIDRKPFAVGDTLDDGLVIQSIDTNGVELRGVAGSCQPFPEVSSLSAAACTVSFARTVKSPRPPADKNVQPGPPRPFRSVTLHPERSAMFAASRTRAFSLIELVIVIVIIGIIGGIAIPRMSRGAQAPPTGP